jgi:hypothetical protein
MRYTATLELPAPTPIRRRLAIEAADESEAWTAARAACTPSERVTEILPHISTAAL